MHLSFARRTIIRTILLLVDDDGAVGVVHDDVRKLIKEAVRPRETQTSDVCCADRRLHDFNVPRVSSDVNYACVALGLRFLRFMLSDFVMLLASMSLTSINNNHSFRYIIIITDL